jgi:hypothetical protein
MTGGNVGMIATLDDATLASTVSDLEKKLEASLKEKAAKQLPQTQKTFDGFQKITYTVEDPKLQGEGQGSKAMIKVDASEKVYALDVESFAKKLLTKANTAVANNETFSIDFSNVKTAFLGEASSTLSISMDGGAKVIWNLDTDAFKKEISGKSVSEVPTIASGFGEIDKVSVIIKPFSFWHPKLPSSPEKIYLSLKTAQQ